MFKQPFKNSQLPTNGLQHIQKNLNVQRKLLQLVRDCLSDELATHCVHVTANIKQATIFTDSPVWASKLLYLRSPILDALSSHFSARVKSMKVKVLSKKILPPKSQPKTPSIKTVNFLTQANAIDSSDQLSIAMNKLIVALQKNKPSS